MFCAVLSFWFCISHFGMVPLILTLSTFATCTVSTVPAADASKYLKVLLSAKAPLIKKRQVMRNAFGDYRKKMSDMEKKSTLGSSQIGFVYLYDFSFKMSPVCLLKDYCQIPCSSYFFLFQYSTVLWSDNGY